MEGAWNYLSNAGATDMTIDSNFSIYLTGGSNKRFLILKNPVLGEFSNPSSINVIDNNMVLTLTTIFSVCGIIGIYFYIRFRRKSLL